MRVAHSAPDQIDIRGRDAMRAPMVLGVALLSAAGLALLATRDSSSFSQALAWMTVGAGGLLAVALSWPRARHIALKGGGDAVLRIDGRQEAIPVAETRLRLSAVRAEGAAGESNYGVVVERDAGPRLILLSDRRPDRVLRDLALVRRIVPLPLSPGWGLPADSRWIDPASTEVAPTSSMPAGVAAASGRTKKSIAGTILVGSAGVTAIIVVDIRNRIVLGDSPSALSLALPVLFVTMLVVIGLGIWTSRNSFGLGAEFVFTRHVLGFAIERRTVARSTIRAAYLVSPDGGTPRHLLLETEAGPESFPCTPADGARVLASLYGGGAEISSAPPTQSRV
jgi:hypothetical protein